MSILKNPKTKKFLIAIIIFLLLIVLVFIDKQAAKHETEMMKGETSELLSSRDIPYQNGIYGTLYIERIVEGQTYTTYGSGIDEIRPGDRLQFRAYLYQSSPIKILNYTLEDDLGWGTRTFSVNASSYSITLFQYTVPMGTPTGIINNTLKLYESVTDTEFNIPVSIRVVDDYARNIYAYVSSIGQKVGSIRYYAGDIIKPGDIIDIDIYLNQSSPRTSLSFEMTDDLGWIPSGTICNMSTSQSGIYKNVQYLVPGDAQIGDIIENTFYFYEPSKGITLELSIEVEIVSGYETYLNFWCSSQVRAGRDLEIELDIHNYGETKEFIITDEKGWFGTEIIQTDNSQHSFGVPLNYHVPISTPQGTILKNTIYVYDTVTGETAELKFSTAVYGAYYITEDNININLAYYSDSSNYRVMPGETIYLDVQLSNHSMSWGVTLPIKLTDDNNWIGEYDGFGNHYNYGWDMYYVPEDTPIGTIIENVIHIYNEDTEETISFPIVMEVGPVADIKIRLAEGQNEKVYPGDTVRYEIDFTKYTPEWLDDLIIESDLGEVLFNINDYWYDDWNEEHEELYDSNFIGTDTFYMEYQIPIYAVPGELVNIVWAYGAGDCGQTYFEASDKIGVTIAPNYTITKEVIDKKEYYIPGEEVTFVVRVENTTGANLHDLEIIDQIKGKLEPEWIEYIPALPKAEEVFEFGYKEDYIYILEPQSLLSTNNETIQTLSDGMIEILVSGYQTFEAPVSGYYMLEVWGAERRR